MLSGLLLTCRGHPTLYCTYLYSTSDDRLTDLIKLTADTAVSSSRIFSSHFIENVNSIRDISQQHSDCCICTQCHKILYIHNIKMQ